MREGFEAIIERLRSDDKDVVCAALKDLRELPAPVESDEALILLKAATEIHDEKCVGISVSGTLVKLAELLAFEDPERLSASYSDLDGEARPAALAVLAKSRSQAAIEQYCSIICAFGWPERSYPAVTLPLRRRPEFQGILFPKLLDLSIPGDLTESYLLALAYAESGLFSSSSPLPTDPLVRDAIELLEFCEPRQRAQGVAWRWEEDYRKARDKMGVALDLLGFAAKEVAATLLERATRLSDPRLQHFAVVSMLRLGLTPDPAAIESVAQSREMRSAFLRALEKLDMAWLFPDEYRRQELIAESDMVNWLCFPTELGREPDEIELIARERTDRDGYEMYVFRFRTHEPHWSAKKGWVVGWAGAYREGVFSSERGDETFSEFEPFQ